MSDELIVRGDGEFDEGIAGNTFTPEVGEDAGDIKLSEESSVVTLSAEWLLDLPVVTSQTEGTSCSDCKHNAMLVYERFGFGELASFREATFISKSGTVAGALTLREATSSGRDIGLWWLWWLREDRILCRL